MDLRLVRGGLRIAAVGAVLLFVFLFFFDWYTVGGALGALADKVGVSKPSVNGWHAHADLRWLMLLTIIGALALAGMAAAGRKVSMAISPSAILTALAGLTTILVAYRVIINGPGPDDLISTQIGAWLGLASLAVVTVGSYLSMKEEGVSFSDAGEQVQSAVGGLVKPDEPEPAAAPAAPAGDEPTTPA
jgi:ABC-type transport system involved in multi-copper enzyme maturation permease subunit